MSLKIGQTLVSTVDSTSVVVVRCPATDAKVTCGGEEMVPPDAAPPTPAGAPGSGGAQLGKRYTVDGVDIELLCVKAGSHPLAVDGTPVVQKGAKPLPASD
jgi:hypothetical protein